MVRGWWLRRRQLRTALSPSAVVSGVRGDGGGVLGARRALHRAGLAREKSTGILASRPRFARRWLPSLLMEGCT